MTPTALLRAALKIKPRTMLRHEGSPVTCSHCGARIAAGDPYAPADDLGEFFSDTRDLVAMSRVVCGTCDVLRTKPVMHKMMSVVVTQRGIYSIRKKETRAWLLLDPPKPPFVAMIGTTTLQHLAWRAPMTVSRDLLLIRVGSDVFRIRRPILEQLVALDARVRQAEPKIHNLLFLDFALIRADHGVIHPKADPLLSPEERQFLRALTPGELWAAQIVTGKRAVTPVKPTPNA